MIVEPAGLLPFPYRRLELHSVFFQGHALGHIAVGCFHIGGQVFGAARTAIILEKHTRWLEYLNQGLDDLAAHPLHTGGGDLHHKIVPKAVYHEPR
ncbi:hypothetical protein GCM10007418_26650 [Halopseudomonas salina]|uniref:Uncharacterized protein n=1 Tax=Halopseudomonas salina TaxID=1323744 RepID=A0ABQ1PXL3_9GAMM|nr:hypothetical protein GCM10007418_26650 [Halopseudomonas salina]